MRAARYCSSIPGGFLCFGFFRLVLGRTGRLGLTATLFLIGTGLSMGTLKQVGVRPLIQGVLLWAAVAITSLLAIRAGLIAM